MEKPRNLHEELMDLNYGEGLLEGRGTRHRGAKGENWDNCDSIINKIHLKRIIGTPEEEKEKRMESPFK